MAKRNQKPEVRKAQREQAIRAAKEAKKTTKVTIAAATLKLAGIKVVPIKYCFCTFPNHVSNQCRLQTFFYQNFQRNCVLYMMPKKNNLCVQYFGKFVA